MEIHRKEGHHSHNRSDLSKDRAPLARLASSDAVHESTFPVMFLLYSVFAMLPQAPKFIFMCQILSGISAHP